MLLSLLAWASVFLQAQFPGLCTRDCDIQEATTQCHGWSRWPRPVLVWGHVTGALGPLLKLLFLFQSLRGDLFSLKNYLPHKNLKKNHLSQL